MFTWRHLDDNFFFKKESKFWEKCQDQRLRGRSTHPVSPTRHNTSTWLDFHQHGSVWIWSPAWMGRGLWSFLSVMRILSDAFSWLSFFPLSFLSRISHDDSVRGYVGIWEAEPRLKPNLYVGSITLWAQAMPVIAATVKGGFGKEKSKLNLYSWPCWISAVCLWPSYLIFMSLCFHL